MNKVKAEPLNYSWPSSAIAKILIATNIFLGFVVFLCVVVASEDGKFGDDQKSLGDVLTLVILLTMGMVMNSVILNYYYTKQKEIN
mmetsp:Transcript_37631/g.27737  ORF Transcript_37631/g.27737 Transcript_37631/m.27737 type:complete len:86 (+) Transcript_37631:194-451(+)